MTILLICDSCKEAVDKEKLLHILAYPKVKIKKSGYKSKLNMDICLDCYEQIFEINRKREEKNGKKVNTTRKGKKRH